MPMSLVLDSHCRSRQTLPQWASGGGFATSHWQTEAGDPLDEPPMFENAYKVIVRAPFAATAEVPFFLLWVPPLVAFNGWEPTYGSFLDELRIVRCSLRQVGQRQPDPNGGRHERCAITIAVLGVDSPRDVPVSATTTAEADALAGVLIDTSASVRKTRLDSDTLTLISTSMQGDVNFDVLIERDSLSLLMIVDTSICQDFFCFGRVRLSDERMARLLKA